MTTENTTVFSDISAQMPLSHSLPMSVHSHSIGNNTKVNQDHFFNLKSDNGLHCVSIIADGHGIHGVIASHTTIDTIRDFFVPHINSLSDLIIPLLDDQLMLQTFFNDIFSRAHSNVRQAFLDLNSSHILDLSDPYGIVLIPCGFQNMPVSGGTTLTITIVVTLIDGTKKVVCANVGDSESIFIKTNSVDQTSVKGMFEHLTVNHSPDNLSEFVRIRDLDSTLYPEKLSLEYELLPSHRYFSLQNLSVFNSEGIPNSVPNGAYHTTIRKDYAHYAKAKSNTYNGFALAMTRAIGDFEGHKYGLTYILSVSIKTVDPSQEFIIITASDGLWDCVKYEEYTDLVRQELADFTSSVGSISSSSAEVSSVDSFESLCQKLCTNSVKTAKSLFGLSGYDDTTISIIIC